MQSNTIIVDFDLAFGTAGLDFNQDPIQGVADALSKPDRLDPVLLDRMIVRCTDRLSLFAAPASLDDDYDFAPEAYEEVATKIRATAPLRGLRPAAPVVRLDAQDASGRRRGGDRGRAGPGVPAQRQEHDRPDHPRPAQRRPAALILNQVGQPGRPEIPVKDFAKALGVEPALCLPYDAKLFGQAANNGQMVQEVNAKAKAAEGLAQFVQSLARRDAPAAAAGKTRSIVERLLKR